MIYHLVIAWLIVNELAAIYFIEKARINADKDPT